MPSSATSRRESSSSDSPGLLNSNRPQVQPNTSNTAAVNRSAPSSQTKRHAAAPRNAESPASLTPRTASGNLSARKPRRSGTPTQRVREPTSAGTSTTSANGNSHSINASATTRSASSHRALHASGTTPRSAAALAAPHPLPSSVGGVRRPSMTVEIVHGPRFTQPTVSSLAHLPGTERKDSPGVATPRSSALAMPPVLDVAQLGGGAALPGRSRPSASSSCANNNSNNVSASETSSLGRPLHHSSGGIQRGGAGPIEPGAAHPAGVRAVSKTTTPMSSTRGQRPEAATTSSSSTSVTDGAEAPRPRRQTRHTAPTTAAASGHRTADPAPTIGQVRRKTHLHVTATKSGDTQHVSQTSQSSQVCRSSSYTSPASTPPPTPGDARGTSVQSTASSSPPQPPAKLQPTMKVRTPLQTAKSLPRPVVTAPRKQAANAPEASPATVTASTGETAPLTCVTSATATTTPVKRALSEETTATASAGSATPLRTPKAASVAASVMSATTEKKSEVASPPPASRPTVAPGDRSPIVYRVPPTETTSGQGLLLAAAAAPAATAVSSTSAAPSPATSEEAPHRSTSPRTPPRSHPAKKPLAVAKSAPAVTPLSTNDLGDSGTPTTATATAAGAAAHRKAKTLQEGVLTPTSAHRQGPSRSTSVKRSSERLQRGRSKSTDDGTHADPQVGSADDNVDADFEVPRQRAPVPSAAVAVHPRSSSSGSHHGPRSIGERSHSPGQESIAALLEDLQLLRQREEEAATRASAAERQLHEEAQAEAEEAAKRSQRKAAAALKGKRPNNLDSSLDEGKSTDTHHQHRNDDDDDDGVDTSINNDDYGTFLFPADVGVDDAAADDSAVRPRPSRATDTTGHAPVTPRLRRRIEQEQQRELELLRTITQERHPENVELLDSPDELIRELSRIDPDMEPEEAEEALLALSSSDGDSRDASLPVITATEDQPPTPFAPPPRAATAAAGASPESVASTPSVSADRDSATGGKPPLRGDVSTSSSEQRRRHVKTEPASSPSTRAPTKSRETSQSLKAPSVDRSTISSAKRAHASTSTTTTATAAAAAATATTPLTTQRPPSARGRATSTAESSGSSAANVSGSSAANVSGNARFTRRPSRAALSNLNSTIAGPGSSEASSSAKPVLEVAERRRRPLTDATASPAAAAAGSLSASPAAAAAVEAGSRAALPRHGGPAAHPADSPHTALPPTAEHLLPALYSAEESAHTVTIVFDLDETLCNNRCLGGTVLRPGAELLLRTLRSLAPSPRYKLIDVRARGQHATNRLYDQAMYKMGMTPLYRPRVAQRQTDGGYHGNIVGGSTGEARPATMKETNPLRLELVLWTASEESLARRAMRRLDPQNAIFDEAIYRDVRWYRDSYYTKELSRLGRSMQRVVIIENSVESVIRNRQNAILVTSFITNRMDRQLFLVREVLRDWVRAMKSYLAVTLENQQWRQHEEEAEQDGEAGRRTSTGSAEGATSAMAKSREEGGESPVPPHVTPSPAHAERTAAAAAEDEEPRPHPTAPAPAPLPTAAIGGTASTTPTTAAAAATTGPRPMSALAQRASNVVQFLHRHRLVLSESNYINFQMTGEVMLRLQSTETAAITAALPPPTEAPPTRTVRTVGCGPAPRSPRAPHTLSTSPAEATSNAPTVVAAATSAGGAAGSGIAPQSGRAGSLSSNSAAAAAAAAAVVGSVRVPQNTSVGANAAAAVAGRARAGSRGDATAEAKQGGTDTPSSSAGNPAAAPNRVPAPRAAREGRPTSAKAEGQDRGESATPAVIPDSAVVRPPRTASVAARRQVA